MPPHRHKYFADLFLNVYADDLRKWWWLYILLAVLVSGLLFPNADQSNARTIGIGVAFVLLPLIRGSILATIRKLKAPSIARRHLPR